MEQQHAFDIHEETEQATTKNGHITRQSRVWQAYRDDEEIMHLKPSTWIAMVAVILSIAGVIFGSGVAATKMVTKQEFRQGLKELKLELINAIQKGAVSRVEYERLKGQIKLLQQRVDFQERKQINRADLKKLLEDLRRTKRKR